MILEKKATLSTQGYRGTRDFYPHDQRLKNHVYSKIKNILISFGYEEYAGPFVEPLELYASKSSEEIINNQLYSFIDRGDRKLAIRPEMTPTLARMVAAKQYELPKPIRWFSIPTCMRFERPQRGRLREFDQLNVDIFGACALDEDIEILLTCIKIMLELGAKNEDFEIKINHRGIVNAFMKNNLHISQKNIAPILRLLDKKDKLTPDVFYTECKNLELSSNQIEGIEEFLSSSIEKIINLLGVDADAARDIKERLDLIAKITGVQFVKFSPDIMRGFDYYTGMVFEVFDTHPDNRRALFGGGRYDNLVGAFGTQELSGIGYGMGDVAILNFLETHKLTPVLNKKTDVCVLRFSENDRLISLQLAQELRAFQINVETIVSNVKFGKQIQMAEKSGSKSVVFRGEDELNNNTFSVKWLSSGSQEIFSYNKEGFSSFITKLNS